MQDARGKGQEASPHNPQPTTHNPEDDLIPESALDALHVPRWRQALLRPFVRRAVEGQAAACIRDDAFPGRVACGSCPRFARRGVTRPFSRAAMAPIAP
jgi:hypothetical protein